VDWDARLVLKGLESYVDDNGVGKDDLALIVADVFPRDLSRNPTGTLQKVSEAISGLHQAGLLWRYTVEGTDLLYVAFWESVQRIEKPTRGRFPRPDGTFNYRDSEIGAPLPEDYGRVPGTLRPGTGEQGNRGTGEQTSPNGDVARKRATRIPEPFIVTADMRAWAAEETPGLKVDAVTKKFVDYWRAKSGKDATKRDWVATWRNWLRTDFERNNVTPMKKPNPDWALRL
jgi:hypothetical protein